MANPYYAFSTASTLAGVKNTNCNASERAQRWMFPSLVSAKIYRDALIHLHSPSSCLIYHTAKSYIEVLCTTIFCKIMQYFLQKIFTVAILTNLCHKTDNRKPLFFSSKDVCVCARCSGLIFSLVIWLL